MVSPPYTPAKISELQSSNLTDCSWNESKSQWSGNCIVADCVDLSDCKPLSDCTRIPAAHSLKSAIFSFAFWIHFGPTVRGRPPHVFSPSVFLSPFILSALVWSLFLLVLSRFFSSFLSFVSFLLISFCLILITQPFSCSHLLSCCPGGWTGDWTRDQRLVGWFGWLTDRLTSGENE